MARTLALKPVFPAGKGGKGQASGLPHPPSRVSHVACQEVLSELVPSALQIKWGERAGNIWKGPCVSATDNLAPGLRVATGHGGPGLGASAKMATSGKVRLHVLF